jgi:O-antigen/teichoic acid export membrane protein
LQGHIRGRSMERNLTWHTFYFVGSLILTRVCGILAKIFMARTISPYEYGLITLIVLVLPGIMQNITNFCFMDILGHATEGKKYFSFALVYGVGSTGIIAILFLLFPEPILKFLNIPLELSTLFSIVFISVLFAVTIISAVYGILRGKRDYNLASTFSAAPSVLRLLFIIAAVIVFKITDFDLLLILFALPAIIVIFPVLVAKRKTIFTSLKSVNIPSAEMISFGFSFFLLSIWLSLCTSIISVVISHDLGIIWQGYFDVSQSMVMIITFFSSAIYMISAPETTVETDRNEILMKPGGLGDIGKILFSMCLLCVIIIYFYSHQLVSFLFSEKYSVSGDYLIILAIGYTVIFLQQYCAYLTISVKKESGLSRLSLVTIISLLIFPVCAHFTVLALGFMGAYLITTVFIVCYTLSTMVLITDQAPLKLLISKIDRLVFSVVITFLVVDFLQLSLIPGVLTCLVLFIMMIFFFGYIDKQIVFDNLASLKGKIT